LRIIRIELWDKGRHHQRRPHRSRAARLSITDMGATDTLDPAVTIDANNTIVIPQIYDTLTTTDFQYNITPRMATSWGSNADLTKWTFKLRPGIKFHDGSRLVAKDVVFSIARQLNPKVGAFLLPVLQPILDPDGITAPNESTVVVHLKKPYAPLPYLMAGFTAGIAQDGTTSFAKTANGTGPFKLTEFTAGQSWSATRNPDYWNSPLPYLAGLQAVSAPNATTKVEGIINGSADLTDTIDYSQATLVKKSSTAALGEVPGTSWYYVALDTQTPPFDDNRVRMAFKLAVDRKELQSVVFAGLGILGNDTAAPATSPYYPQNWPLRTQQITAAKQLLAEAGHSNGLDVTLHTSSVTGGFVDLAVAYAKTVAPAGIRVTVHQDPSSTYWTNVWRKEPMVVSFFTPAMHPAMMLLLNYAPGAGYNDTNIKSSPIPDLVDKATATKDAGKQKALYNQALRWIGDNGGNVGPVWANFIYAKNASLRGQVDSANGGYLLDQAYFA
jgi:peptide/nickel transport system substrate-binding protein